MYSSRWINIISLILATILFVAISIIWNNFPNQSVVEPIAIVEESKSNDIPIEKVDENTSKGTATENVEETNAEYESKTKEKWEIEIPKISLIADISEGTDEKTLNQFVGHFTITPKTKGNIGLAAHNRGYPVNYFENLKELKGGEEIIYTYGEFSKTYVVTQNIKISDIDWSYLENTSENKITLITCSANEPAYRRCVQAIEKEEN